jgi:hypothetical protein
MSKQQFPAGWDEKRVRQVLAHYKNQTNDEQSAEIEAARETDRTTRSSVPSDVVKTVYEIDGRNFSTLGEFFAVVGRVLIPGADWGHNLDAFNDILRGGFGTPDGGFVLRWKNSNVSRERLGYPETVRQLQRRLGRCHPSNRELVAAELEQARRNVGPTVFDWLVEIIQTHGAEGAEKEDGVMLILD